MSDQFDRRDFFKAAALTGVGLAMGTSGACASTGAGAGRRLSTPPPDALFRAPAIETVRIGFVGVGNQGTGHVRNFLNIPGVEIKAIADVQPQNAARSEKIVVDAGKPRPTLYTNGPDDYKRMIDQEQLDLVFTATPWEMHAPVLLYAMRAGAHAATEIPLAVSMDELWELVETAERTQRHCVMMENCCYDRVEMMIHNMKHQGLFGELLHAECGYLHDLRALKLSPDYYYDQWRLKHALTRNGDLYPMHGLGPVAQWMDINRGNQFDYLVSMSTPSRGLKEWAAEHIGPDSREAQQNYALGDVVNTLIKTVSGQSILVTHDTHLPRPYSRKILLQGTNGLVRKYPEAKIHVEGRSPDHRWEELQSYQEEFEHPIWKALQERAAGAGHGGMDYIEDFRLIESLRTGTPVDMDVYDGAAWTATIMLSERSIANRSAPQDFPDFTRGAWRNRPPLGIIQTNMA